MAIAITVSCVTVQAGTLVNCLLLSADTTSTTGINAVLEIRAMISNAHQVPFWMRSNQYGAIPNAGVGAIAITTVQKNYDSDIDWKRVRWGFGVEAFSYAGQRPMVRLTEGFGNVRWGIFELEGGRSKEFDGLIDSTLSSGAFAISGNALGIPKISLAIKDYWNLPLTNKVIGIKGTISHGWLGQIGLNAYDQRIQSVNTNYHQLSIYGRIGKPESKLKLYGGINHHAFWGGESKIFGTDFRLNRLQTYWHVLTGTTYGNRSVPGSKIGDHLGSVDQAAEFSTKNLNFNGYHQFFYDQGGLYHLSNIKDGLWGFVVENRNVTNKRWYWKKFLFEFMNSKSQGGELDAVLTPSGAENYYHSMYEQGWTYKGQNLGSNFLTNRRFARTNLPMRDKAFIVNNRIRLFHFGLQGGIGSLSFFAKASLSFNYGTYATDPIGVAITSASLEGEWIDGRKRKIYPPPYFQRTRQLSFYLACDYPIKNKYMVGIVTAFDNGGLLYDSHGIYFSLKKNFSIAANKGQSN